MREAVNVDSAIAEALARIMQRVALRLSEHQPKSATFYKRSVSQRLRRKTERDNKRSGK